MKKSILVLTILLLAALIQNEMVSAKDNNSNNIKKEVQEQISSILCEEYDMCDQKIKLNQEHIYDLYLNKNWRNY